MSIIEIPEFNMTRQDLRDECRKLREEIRRLLAQERVLKKRNFTLVDNFAHLNNEIALLKDKVQDLEAELLQNLEVL